MNTCTLQPSRKLRAEDGKHLAMSVILTNHNYARYLPAALESVFHQTLPAAEIIVVDDGSTDGSRTLLTSYASQIRILHTNGNGQWHAAMAGFQISSGMVVVFLDADDLLTHDAHAAHAANFAFDDACVVSQGQMDLVNQQGLRIPGRLFLRQWLEGDLSRIMLTEGRLSHWPYTSGNAWRRDVVQAACDLAPQVRNALDGVLHAIAPLFGTYRDCRAIVARYRIHGKNMSLNEGIDKLTQSAQEEWSKLTALSKIARTRGFTFDAGLAILQSPKQIRNFLSWHLLHAETPAGMSPMTMGRAWLASLRPNFPVRWGYHLMWMTLLSCSWPALRRRMCYRTLSVIPAHLEVTARGQTCSH
jgi:glycosyltransferase involved in cell wall biosynthesis